MPTPPKLVFASHNTHKVAEMRELLKGMYRIEGLSDIGFHEALPEPFDTFEANALSKATHVFKNTGLPCFADDSGLVVDALDGRPGVLSARYAGLHKSDSENVAKVLSELAGQEHRTARFVAVIAFRWRASDFFSCRGEVKGSISLQPEGLGGFGYDPVFIPAGFESTFGILPASLKNRISHRARAMEKFLEFLPSITL